jgi:hypothetical protein
MLFSQSGENHETVDEHSDEHLDFIHTHASTLYIYHIIYIYIYIYTFMIYIYIYIIYIYCVCITIQNIDTEPVRSAHVLMLRACLRDVCA